MNQDALGQFQSCMILNYLIYLRELLLRGGVWPKCLGLFLDRSILQKGTKGTGSFLSLLKKDRVLNGQGTKKTRSLLSQQGGKNLKIEELEKELKNEKLSSLYLLYGEEKFLLENSLKKIKNLFGECLKGINYITIDDTNLRRNNFRFRNSEFWL